jgi:ribosomal protein S18 acetylase RimI-like enzyme
MLFASRPVGAAGRRHAALAIDAVAADLPEADLAQAIVEVEDRAYAAAYEAADFTRLAVLSYQELKLPARPPAAPTLPPDVEVRSYADFDPVAADDLFRRALDASYEETQDCPLLRGIRRTSDVLEGHKATGEFDADLWSVVLQDNAPEGVLLLSYLPERATHELVYLGLSPRLRGRGVARALLQQGIRQLAARRGKTLTLAVDEANEPALRLYRSFGFRRSDRRLALIRNIGLNSKATA